MEGQIVEMPSANAIHPVISTNLTTTITRKNYTFTINTETYQMLYHQTMLGCMVWLLLGVSSTICLVQLQLGLDFAPFFIEIAMGFIPINIFIFRAKKHFTKMIRVWFILTSIALLALGIILAIKVNYLGIVLSAYALVQLLAGFSLVRKRGFIIIKLLAILQAIVIGFKEDGLISSTYSQICFAMAIFFIACCLFSLAIIFYLIISSFCFSNPLFFVKKQGFIYTVCNILSICSIIGIPLLRAYTSNNYIASLLVATLVCLLSATYTYSHIEGIIIYLCDYMQVEEKKEPARLQACSSPYTSFFKASSTWMVSPSQASRESKIYQSQECLACLSNEAQVLWIPCGHCVLCFDCTKNLVIKTTQCALCKMEPELLLKVRRKSRLNLQVHPNEVQVAQCFKIISR